MIILMNIALIADRLLSVVVCRQVVCKLQIVDRVPCATNLNQSNLTQKGQLATNNANIKIV